MDNYTEIRNKIRAMTGQKTPLLLTGKVESVDSDYPTKGGLNYVTGTEISFSKEGGERTVSLGRWLSK